MCTADGEGSGKGRLLLCGLAPAAAEPAVVTVPVTVPAPASSCCLERDAAGVSAGRGVAPPADCAPEVRVDAESWKETVLLLVAVEDDSPMATAELLELVVIVATTKASASACARRQSSQSWFLVADGNGDGSTSRRGVPFSLSMEADEVVLRRGGGRCARGGVWRMSMACMNWIASGRSRGTTR